MPTDGRWDLIRRLKGSQITEYTKNQGNRQTKQGRDFQMCQTGADQRVDQLRVSQMMMMMMMMMMMIVDLLCMVRGRILGEVVCVYVYTPDFVEVARTVPRNGLSTPGLV